MSVSARITPQAAQELLAKKFVAPRTRSAKQPRARKPARAGQQLGETLMRIGKIDREQLAAILAAQKRYGGSFGKNAVKLGFVKPSDVQIALGVESGFIREDTFPRAIPMALLVARNPYSPAAEQFRLMRTRLVAGAASASADLFSIVGAHQKSNADYVAANFAACLAQLGRRVLLIDADLRTPSLHDYFCVRNKGGLGEVLAGNLGADEAIRQTFLKSLDLVSAGAPSNDPQSLLCRPLLEELFDASRKQYDHVAVLTAPYGAAADGEFVWSTTGNTLVVARRNKARLADLKKMKAVLRDVGAGIIGAVMMD